MSVRTDTARTANRLLLAAVRHSAPRTAVLCLTSAAGSAAALLLPTALGRALDLLLRHGTAAQAARWTLLCAALLAASVALDAAQTLLSGTTDARTTAWLRDRLLHRILGIGPDAAARFTPGDLVARCTGNAATAGTAATAVASLVATLITPVGALVALTLIDPWLSAVFLAGGPLLALLLRTFAHASSDCVARYQRAQGAMAGRLVEALTGARTIAAAGTAEWEAARVLEPLPELSRQGHRMWQVQGRATGQAAVLVPLLQTAVLAVGGVRLGTGHLSVGELLAASRYAVLATGVGVFVGRLAALVSARAAVARAAEVLAVPAMPYGDRKPPGGDGELELRGVTVVRGGVPVLDGLDLRVPGGSSVAVVGRSGAGKSVLAAVAGRLTDPDAGTVLLDGVPLPRIARQELRREVGYAFERPALFGTTIADAIGYGVDRPAPERCVAAARAAHADDFVRLLPGAYQTERARAPLSGGEIQRLGLARAFAHCGRLLILDDATSSLDSVTELRISEALAHHVPARTRLLIAHRASTAARADLVVWLEDGRVRAVGPHGRLWKLAEYRAVFGGSRSEGAADDGS
ncbi:ABC transporter ATP-binding protein [Streptomyces ferralitis]|uniref:ABC transporter ATP-binding protein n=1 Tax=Streptantibioticus ferralitis TaxID=236510 RepID=A0ABT5Z205_9ACTN|nr:ABC transporter ATP-binding protein [Streptantibioticus ferralitis]MDF2257611.1 ABC transporter ATP-binding protein [Streptantibioticus ferralitis]